MNNMETMEDIHRACKFYTSRWPRPQHKNRSLILMRSNIIRRYLRIIINRVEIRDIIMSYLPEIDKGKRDILKEVLDMLPNNILENIWLYQFTVLENR